MMVLGLVSLVFAAFMLYRRRDIKRLFAYSSIEHMGIITFAFGMGGPLANFAGLLHMTMHSLTKSAIFFAVGHVAQVEGDAAHRRHQGAVGDAIRCWRWVLRSASSPSPACRRSACSPREFMLVSSSFARQPVLAVVLVFGLIVAFGALILRAAGRAVRRAERAVRRRSRRTYVPLFLHLALVLIAGSGCRSRWCAGSAPWRRSWDDADERTPQQAARRTHARCRATGRGRATRSTTMPWVTIGAGAGRGRRRPARPVGRQGQRSHGAARRRAAAVALRRFDCCDGTASFPRSAASIRRRSGSSARSAISTASRRSARRTGGRGSITARGACARRSVRGSPTPRRDPADVRISARARRRPAPDSGRPGARRHHRARPFPLHRQRRDRGAARGAARLRPQGHRRAAQRRRHRAGRARGRARLRRLHRGLQLRVRPRGRGGAARSSRRRAPRSCAASWRSSSASPIISATSARSATTRRSTLIHAHCGIFRERVLAAADRAFGHRLMMDRIVPGGVEDMAPGGARGILLHARGDRAAVRRDRAAL